MNMKKLIIVCLACISLAGSYAQEYYRYFNGEKHYFEISSNKVIFKVNEKLTEDAIETSFRKNSSLQVSDISATAHQEYKLASVSDVNRNAMMQLTNQWKSNDTILFVGQVIIDESGRETAAITDQISIRLKDDNDFLILQKALASYEIGKIEQYDFDCRTYFLFVNYFSEKSALQIANELHETGLFEYASPTLLLFIRYATNDTHYGQQWGLHHSLYGIRAPQAWNITTGSSNIRIAILDSGVDLGHPDLALNLIAGLGFDATGVVAQSNWTTREMAKSRIIRRKEHVTFCLRN